MNEDALRAEISQLVGRYAEQKYRKRPFMPGETPVPASGKVLGFNELDMLVAACLDGWLTTGHYNQAFERTLADFVGIGHVLTTNSGSSANLLAVSALTSPQLGKRALRAGDEVITVAAGFPTTVNPCLLYGLVPVFVDVAIPFYNIDPTLVEAAVSDRTRAIILAHTLGNSFDLDAIRRIADKYELWLIEDCCDALGTRYNDRHVGTFGDIATLSFYPAHHITMGEGGAVLTNSGELRGIIESMRDWGRDCYCEPGADNTCGRRFAQQLGELPAGYDHKYTYSHLGFNLKISDMQAACGLAQMERLPGFIDQRKRNFEYLHEQLSELAEFVILPRATAGCDPSWFGFPITLREDTGINRTDLLKYLDQYRIGTRLLFAGNLTRQPYFRERNYRISGELTQTDRIMRQTFWIGVYPGLDTEQLAFVVTRLEHFFGRNF